MVTKEGQYNILTQISNICYKIHMEGKYEVQYIFNGDVIEIYIKLGNSIIINFLSYMDDIERMNEIYETLGEYVK